MTFLLDTCALLWWWSEPDKLSRRVLDFLKNPQNDCYVSAASAWEVSTKYRIGKYPAGIRVVSQWETSLAIDGFRELAIGFSHALKAGMLPSDHRDPFDRMIAAQSILENIPVITSDQEIGRLGAQTIW